MKNTESNERTIFLRALDVEPGERNAFLEQACAGDKALRQKINELLDLHEQGGSLPDISPEEFADASSVSSDGADATVATNIETDETLDVDPRILHKLDFLEPAESPEFIGKIGSYHVIELVGRGGMGVVLRARDPKLDRIVAIKVMAPELAASPNSTARFLREARAAAAVSHDHVVTIHAVDDEWRLPYLVMEFVAGMSLEDMLRKQSKVELCEILRIGMQTARGLSAAHRQGLVHRDIKPANILLENSVHRVKITDFGLARAVDDVELTSPGMVSGSPKFMSPEQAAGIEIDQRSDLFSLGTVMYAMCTGSAPFSGKTLLTLLEAVRGEQHRPIHRSNPNIPPELEELIDRLLEKDPQDRFQTAEEVADILEALLSKVQADGYSPYRHSAARSTGSAQWWAFGGLAAAAMACMYFFFPDSGSPSSEKQSRLSVTNSPPSTIVSELAAATASTEQEAPGFPVLTPGKRLDLLATLNPETDSISGTWRRVGSAVRVSSDSNPDDLAAASRIRFPMTIDGDYRLSFSYQWDQMRKEDDKWSAALLTLPIPGHEGGFNFFFSPDYAISSVDGETFESKNNKTRKYNRQWAQRGEHWVTIYVSRKETNVVVKVLTDGRRALEWKGPPSALNYEIPEYGFGAKQGGIIVTGRHGVRFHQGRIEMLNGQALVQNEEPAFADQKDPEPIGPGKVIDMLAMADLSRDTILGDWSRKDGALSVADMKANTTIDLSTFFRVRMPLEVHGSYILRASFIRPKTSIGRKRVIFILPVGKSGHDVLCAFGDKDVHLNKVNDKIDNETNIKVRELTYNTEHHTEISVLREGKDVNIKVILDGKRVIDWNGPSSALGITGRDVHGAYAPGVMSHGSRAIFTAATLEMVEGKAIPMRAPAVFVKQESVSAQATAQRRSESRPSMESGKVSLEDGKAE